MVPRSKMITYRSRSEQYSEEAQRVSRSFSWDAKELLPENEIARAMPLASAADLEEEKQLDWQTFMDLGEAQDTSEELKIISRQMVKAWGELCEALPKDTKKKKMKIEWPTVSISKDEDLETHGKMMKVKSGYQNLCSVADRYSGLFKLIPSGNEYVSVTVGVVTTIVTVRIPFGDGFHTAIEKIGEEIRYCADMLNTFKNCPTSEQERMQAFIAGVFVQVFSFLVPYSKWCRSRFKRFISSQDNNYYAAKVEGPLAGIIAKTGAITRQRNMQMARIVIDIQETVQRLVADKAYKRQEFQEMKDQVASVANSVQRLREELGRKGNLFIKISAEHELYRKDLMRIEEVQRDPRKKQHVKDLWTSAIEFSLPARNTIATNEAEQNKLRWKDVELASRHLEITSESGYPKGISEVSMAASYLVLVSERLKVPCVAYRMRAEEFGISKGISEGQRSVQMDRMTLMVYSLMLPLLVCVLDGFELVDNDVDPEGTSAYLDLLLDLLRKAGQDRSLKVLIASAGPCITLLSEENVAFDEQVHVLHREDLTPYFIGDLG